MALNLTTDQKKALAKVLTDIARADVAITKNEEQYLSQIRKFIELSLEDMKEAMDMSVTSCLLILRKMDKNQKQAVLYIMNQMVNADGHNSDDETTIFTVVCAAADIPIPMDL
jgi:uncharacterized tellurite resistance protein B-like protein